MKWQQLVTDRFYTPLFCLSATTSILTDDVLSCPHFVSAEYRQNVFTSSLESSTTWYRFACVSANHKRESPLDGQFYFMSLV